MTNMRYSCKGVCINGDFKPFNQDWISLDRFDQFIDLIPVIFCGVYDGHGILGHNSSKYCGRHLPKEFIFELYEQYNNYNNKNKKIFNKSTNHSSFASQPSDNEDNQNNQTNKNEEEEDDINNHPLLIALKNSLSKINNNLCEISQNESIMFSTILQRQGCESRLIDYGTTVVAAACDGYDLFIINVGDSRCILIEGYYDNKNKWTLSHKQITNDHNPILRLDEQERVKKNGGTFFKQNNEYRLYPKDKSFKEARRKGLAINMTRAVGHSTLSKYGLIAKPESYHIKIKDDHEYILILASDGIWDILENEQIFKIVESIYSSFIHNQSKTTIENEIAIELLETAEKKWRKKRVGDNISVIVTRIVKNTSD